MFTGLARREASRPLLEDVAEDRHAGCSVSRHRAPVLRRCLASVAGDLGYNEPIIATLIIHKAHEHQQVVHSYDAVFLAAADAVANTS
jgi:hypothetical protein